MSTEHVIDGSADEIGTAVAIADPPKLAVMPQVQAAELVGRLNVIREAMNTAMQVDVDYGNVPGTSKPTLFKPGAEKLSVLFQLDVQVVNTKEWGPGDHLTVESKATVFHAPTGQRLGSGEGMATTKEKKHAVRKQERVCPQCEQPAVIKGKEEFGGGWLCWKKRDGCGAKFRDGDPSIEGQEVGTVENPDLPDLWNTVVKMAQKRARVDAVLAVTGASALFTQDVEDSQPDGYTPPPPVERDVKRSEASDVPAPDPWFEEVKPLLKGVHKSGLKAAVVAAGGEVPERVSSWQRVICALDAGGRERFVTALGELAGDPWAQPDAGEEQAGSVEMALDLDEARAEA